MALLLACGLVNAQPRPQMDAADAAKHRVADYLGDWAPSAIDRGAKPDFVVAADGSGTHRTLQAALDAVPAQGRRHVIEIQPGTYREQVCAKGKAPITLRGSGDAEKTVIVFGRYNAARAAPNPCEANDTTPGTAGSASVALFVDDLQITNLTIANDAMEAVHDGIGYPPGAGESGGAQAVALMLQGDRVQLQNVRLLGHQDTLYARGGRILVQQSLVAGDVDFIFGNATLVIADSTILNRAGRRKPGNGGHVLAPSTAAAQRLGFLVERSRFVAEPGVADHSISLGRAWDHGVAAGTWVAGVSPNGQALVRDSEIGAHVGPWSASTSRRPFDAATHRFAEYRNDVSRQVLPANDGWAAAEGSTRGGSAAAVADVHTVRSRAELVAALQPHPRPRIVKVVGRIDLSADDAGRPLGFDDYRDPAFDLDAYVRAYDPAVWGKKPPSGPLEEARQRSAKRQSARVQLRVPSNTTVIGIGPDAALVHGGLLLDHVDNVIVRNLHFADAYDHFPAWDPNDNHSGEWNSDYDNLSLRRATHVWVDHCTFDDGERPDAGEPVLLGRRVQHHDGLLDITQQSSFVTVSWSVFRQHDKTMLIGSSDGQQLDEGRLKVTLHHNLWDGLKERTPRVRYGEVHAYNNLFAGPADGGYSLGIGHRSRLFSERNVWQTAAPAARLTRWLKGTAFFDRGSLLNGQPVDLLAALRAANPGVEIGGDVGWQPVFVGTVDAAEAVAAPVRAAAGAGRL